MPSDAIPPLGDMECPQGTPMFHAPLEVTDVGIESGDRVVVAWDAFNWWWALWLLERGGRELIDEAAVAFRQWNSSSA